MKRIAGFFLATTVLLPVVNADAADTVKIGAVYALTGAGAVATYGIRQRRLARAVGR